jgi:recombination protein RecA
LASDLLQPTLDLIHQRWGRDAIRKLGHGQPNPVRRDGLPTGFETLDRVLGAGGVPRGCITEIQGALSSGLTTLALKLIAGAQRAGNAAVYVGLELNLDPVYAARCGVEIEELLLVHPRPANQALAIVYDLIVAGGADLIVVDPAAGRLEDILDVRQSSSALSRLSLRLARTACAVVVLNHLPAGGSFHDPGRTSILTNTALKLCVERERWIEAEGDVRGFEARVTVLKDRLTAPGREALIRVAPEEWREGVET